MQPTHRKEKDKDVNNERFITGLYQVIPKNLPDYFDSPVFAAGAVLWRKHPTYPNIIEYAIVHRPFYDDWSLPKGKLDPGESLPMTAVREIAEETGFTVCLSSLLGYVTYPIRAHTKVVFYWCAEYTGGNFLPNDEVDELLWLSHEEARARVSYDLDRAVLDCANDTVNTTTTRIMLVRHSAAISKGDWPHGDITRPLSERGTRYAQYLAHLLAPYQPHSVHSAPSKRTEDTARIIGQCCHRTQSIDHELRADSTPEEIAAYLTKLMQLPGTHVCVGHKNWITTALHILTEHTPLHNEHMPSKKASTWIMEFRAPHEQCAHALSTAYNNSDVRSATYYESPKPLR